MLSYCRLILEPDITTVSSSSIFCHILLSINIRFLLYVVIRPSVVCLSRLSVTFVHATQAIEIFRNVFTPFGTFDIY